MNEPEYTLPGVMRFLQTEWQRNERDRIQWDIERAEMKSRIAKLEGEKQELLARSDGYEKASAKTKKQLSSGLPVELPSNLESEAFEKLVDGKQQLSKCVGEIRYLLEQSGLSLEDTPSFRDEIEFQTARRQKFGAKSYLHSTLANYATAFPALVFLSEMVLVLGTVDGQLLVVDLESPANSPPTYSYRVFEGSVTTMRCDVEDRVLYACDDKGTLAIFKYEPEYKTLCLMNSLEAHSASIVSVTLSTTHSLFVTASLDGTCSVWKLSKLGENEASVSNCRTASMRFYPESLAINPTAVWFSDDAFTAALPTNQIIIGYSDSSIVVADAVSGQMVKRMYSPPSSILLERAAPSITAIVSYGVPNGDKLLLTAHATGMLRIWNVRMGTMVEEVEAAHRKPITSVSLSPRKDALVVTSEDGHVSLWTLQLGGVTWKGQLLSHDSLEAGGALSSGWFGDMLAIGGSDEIARVYNMAAF
ncbi:Factor arrest protein 8 [Wickerhamiella sorbophila]|uniref:Factor arrest protein 8 n=1 Tax=Wickerhamiella sorbophila TaxID=45607 RepID=A0A2T0FNA4_9ASCO|nr:Factor arrest protein 8 [Wickerhamiella sorbophila]PRT56449.1 Factor arrest protein 8 [Wickerhamiella sorbophila]